MPAVTERYVSKDKARNLPIKKYLSQGIIRAGFEPSIVFVNGEIPLNSKQKEALELAMIKKGLTSDNLITEFSDETYDKKLKHTLSRSFGEIVKEATNNAADMDWPPPKFSEPDIVDVLMINYSPDTGRPDGITPDELLLATEPYPTGEPYTYPSITETQEACGNCKFFVDGGACALVKGAIDPIHGISKFYEAGTPLPFNMQVFPIYEQVEAEYVVKPYEPYLQETIIDRQQQLESDGVPENEISDILRKEYGDISIVETWEENKHPRDSDGKFASGGSSQQGNTKIKISKNVIPEHLSQMERLWDSLTDEDRSLVDNLVIKGSKSNQKTITMGEWKSNNTMQLITHTALTENDYQHTIFHELGHAKFKQLSDSQRTKWGKSVEDIMPPTHYAKMHRDRIRNYESNWGMGSMRWHRAPPDERKIIENNIKIYTNLYHEEIHSEITSHVRSGGISEKRIYSPTGLTDATVAYERLYQ